MLDDASCLMLLMFFDVYYLRRRVLMPPYDVVNFRFRARHIIYYCLRCRLVTPLCSYAMLPHTLITLPLFLLRYAFATAWR